MPQRPLPPRIPQAARRSPDGAPAEGRSTPPPLREHQRGAVDATTETRAREAEQLVEAARNGDPRAFEMLVKRYRHRIFALALHMTGSPSDADDITQDAFVRAFKNIHRFEGRSEFFTWLYRIALHRALNVKRDRKRRPTVDLEDARVEIAAKLEEMSQ